MKGTSVFKRIGAYLLDAIVVMVIGTIFANMKFINPNYDKYIEINDIYREKMDAYLAGDITMEEFQKVVEDTSYDMNKNGIVYIACDLVIIVLYFGVCEYLLNGQTLGKKLFNIRVVSNKDKKLNVGNYLIRTVILNGVILDIVNLIALQFSKGTYQVITSYASTFNTCLFLIIFVMILFNKEGRGLHDVIAGTKVIDLKQMEEVKEEN